jgi:hypothetical protein
MMILVSQRCRVQHCAIAPDYGLTTENGIVRNLTTPKTVNINEICV